ncbi:MAG: T9SS type A sorting domain-containing protein [Muribaculaceae bacterium]|nr:T9SS type A sorting domain-containing protein [Muribaculaceae bacterium]MBR5377643.1 T9SS type A sorting domain-containing protein [Bacteroidales bacterium]
MRKELQLKKSLALLGHGKWKSALGHTLLIIGMVLVSLGAWAQVDPANPNIPKGLVMNKWFEPDDPNDGTSGNIFLETYVTGHSVAQHKPTDIVLVLDVSGSMDENMTSYTYSPRTSQGYTYSNYPNNNGYYYKHSNGQYYQVSTGYNYGGGWGNWYIYYYLSFTVNNTTYYLSGTGVTTTRPSNVQDPNTTIWTGVLYTRDNGTSKNKLVALQEAVCDFVDNIAEDATNYNVDHRISIVKYAMNAWYTNEADITEGDHDQGGSNRYNYTEVVVNRRAPKTQAQSIKDAVNGLHAGGATAADYGMNKARYVLASILDEEGAEEFNNRSKVVVMFTDGAPTHESNFSTTVAGTTIARSNELKHSWTHNGTNYAFNAPVFTIGVFDNETDNIRNYMNAVSSNYPNATGWGNYGTKASDDYYYKAESAEGLKEIFTTIAGASGAMALPAATIVQDAVSPSFQLPNGASDVTAYAPEYYYDEEAGEYKFEDLNDAGTLVIGTITDPATGNPITGVVTGGGENKLPSDFITMVGNDKIQVDGFNFSHHWVGTVDDIQGNPTAHGRKLVIKIHIEIADDGSWGDGIATNVPEDSYIQAPDPEHPGQYVYYGPFPPASANVMGSVWTEVVTTMPEGFDPMNIDSPEDLAWFISHVNGRAYYKENNKVESHPAEDGKLTADIDMSAHNWVPIGAGYKCNANGQYVDATGQPITEDNPGIPVRLTYEGTFDGNGHVITGLKNNASKFYKVDHYGDRQVVVFPGMFADVSGTIKNVFVLDADFRGKHHNEHFVHHGIIADTLEAGGMIFNCEAAGRITCNNDEPAKDKNLKYGGLVGLNRGTIHSCMAMAELTGYTLGGMIAENEGRGKFSNGFTNGIFHYLGTTAGAENKPVAGIVAINPTAANVSNCYVRFSRESSGLNQTTGFRQIAGGNNFDSQSCYSPSLPEHASEILTVNTAWNQSIPSNGFGIDYTNTRNQSRMREDRSNDNMVGGSWERVEWTDPETGETQLDYMILDGGTSMLKKLNAGVASGQASWKRTTAIGNNYSLVTSPNGGNINGDYPILEFSDYKCVASADGIRLDYAATLDQMLDRHNTGNMNVNSRTYIEEKNPSIYGGAINLYANDANVTKSTMSATSKDGETVSTVVYIDENVSLLQGDGSNIEAYTGQTIKDFGSSYDEDGVRWHNVSSSLTGSKFGWTYGEEGEVEHNWDPNPCIITLNVSNDDEALFPTDARSFNVIDFYCFYEPQYHWINFRRNSLSHWHMDNYNQNIGYDNETEFIPGKGYLMALYTEYFGNRHLWNDDNDGSKNGQFVQNRGILNNGDNISIKVTADAPEWTGLKGYNLLGNPYQSYLDFEKFKSVNSSLWSGEEFANTYAVYDPESDAWLQYGAESSEGAKVASQYINMHQGFMIRVSKKGEAKFNNAMRVNNPGENYPGFRGTVNYPLINFFLDNGQDSKNVAVLELGRPENGGAEKLNVGSTKGRISLRHDNQDFGILFRDITEGSQPLYFETEEDGTFTLSWNTANANFSSLTLVDNLTGVRYDMLANDSYSFEGKASDYRSRFKVVIGRFTDVEENEETVTDNFAFFDGSDWIVNGQGQLTVTDMTGRTVYTSNLTNDQNRVSLNGVANGIYLMRVANGQNVNVQKIVVR